MGKMHVSALLPAKSVHDVGKVGTPGTIVNEGRCMVLVTIVLTSEGLAAAMKLARVNLGLLDDDETTEECTREYIRVLCVMIRRCLSDARDYDGFDITLDINVNVLEGAFMAGCETLEECSEWFYKHTGVYLKRAIYDQCSTYRFTELAESLGASSDA